MVPFFLIKYFPNAELHISLSYECPTDPFLTRIAYCLFSAGTMKEDLQVKDLQHLGPLGNVRRLLTGAPC